MFSDYLREWTTLSTVLSKILTIVSGGVFVTSTLAVPADALDRDERAGGNASVVATAIGNVYTVRMDPTDHYSPGYGSALGAAQDPSKPTGVRDAVVGQSWSGTSGQQWKMKVVDTDPGGNWIVTFQNLRYSNICLDKSLDSSGATSVYLYTCTGAENQRWLLIPTSIGPNEHHVMNMYAWRNGQAATLDNDWIKSWVGGERQTYAIYVL
jgi:hypothetical protein